MFSQIRLKFFAKNIDPRFLNSIFLISFVSFQTIEAAIKEFQTETRNLITTQQRILSATPTGLQHLGGNVTPNSGTPKTGRTVSQQDIRMMLGRG